MENQSKMILFDDILRFVLCYDFTIGADSKGFAFF